MADKKEKIVDKIEKTKKETKTTEKSEKETKPEKSTRSKLKKSAKPSKTPKVKSIKLSEKEFEKKILDLAKSSLTAEKIGESLRKEGIHPSENKIKISKVLKKNNTYENPDLKNIQAKLERVKNHYEKNPQDKRAMREKDRIFSQVRKLKKHLGVPLK